MAWAISDKEDARSLSVFLLLRCNKKVVGMLTAHGEKLFKGMKDRAIVYQQLRVLLLEQDSAQFHYHLQQPLSYLTTNHEHFSYILQRSLCHQAISMGCLLPS